MCFLLLFITFYKNQIKRICFRQFLLTQDGPGQPQGSLGLLGDAWGCPGAGLGCLAQGSLRAARAPQGSQRSSGWLRAALGGSGQPKAAQGSPRQLTRKNYINKLPINRTRRRTSVSYTTPPPTQKGRGRKGKGDHTRAQTSAREEGRG